MVRSAGTYPNSAAQPPDAAPLVRPLTEADSEAVRRILATSDYIHYRFGPDELSNLLRSLPASGAWSVPPPTSGRLRRVTDAALQAFLMVNWLVPPSAWIGGFGVTWSEGERYAAYLDALLPPLERLAAERGARWLYYSGNDLDSDWLAPAFEARDFSLITLLRSYDKDDYGIPDAGNQTIRVRPFAPADAPALVALEELAFPQLWRHDAANFLAIARTHPYFVVAEDERGIAGYQFNAVDGTTGYLIRIATHPRVWGQGVGARLLAEAVRYFAAQGVWRIALNTEETNMRAHALYERFGFHRVGEQGFVLARRIQPPEQPANQ